MCHVNTESKLQKQLLVIYRLIIYRYSTMNYLILETGKVLKVEGDGYSEFLNIEDKVLYKDGGEEDFLI